MMWHLPPPPPPPPPPPAPPAASSYIRRVFLPLLGLLNLPWAAEQTQAQPPPRTYLETVCKPPTLRAGDSVPPCVSIEVIEALCFPNGSAPIHLEAHAQCMCQGSYFPDWNGCRACLSVHGLLSDRDRAFHQSVVTRASSSLCGFLTDATLPRPTAIFRALFSAVEATMPGHPTSPPVPAPAQPKDDGPGPDDKYPSRTEASLYYTPSGLQGLGSITGSATAATATGLDFATGRPSFGSGSGPLPGPSSTTTTGHAGSTETVSGGTFGGPGSGGGGAGSTAVAPPASGSEFAVRRPATGIRLVLFGVVGSLVAAAI